MWGRLEADVELESIALPLRKFLGTELSIEVIDVWPTASMYYVYAMRCVQRTILKFVNLE